MKALCTVNISVQAVLLGTRNDGGVQLLVERSGICVLLKGISAETEEKRVHCSYIPNSFFSNASTTGQCRRGWGAVDWACRWVVDGFNITDTMNCSCGMDSGEGAGLCQKQSVAGFTEDIHYNEFLQLHRTFPATVAGANVEVHRGILLGANHG